MARMAAAHDTARAVETSSTSDLVLDAKVRLDLLDVLLLLHQPLGVDVLVVADLAQLLDSQLLEVGRLWVELLVVPVRREVVGLGER